jgi:hypothetical protein
VSACHTVSGPEEHRQYMLDGLRRIRSQTNAQAKQESKQKDVTDSKKWLTWRQAQNVREKALLALEEAFESIEKQVRALQRAVLLIFFTIAPPPRYESHFCTRVNGFAHRCSIIRLLEWNVTLVKSPTDSQRYVVDLKSHPNAPAANHKTVKHYRRALLPLPLMMTEYLERLREERKTGFVFLNHKRKQYSASEFFCASMVFHHSVC